MNTSVLSGEIWLVRQEKKKKWFGQKLCFSFLFLTSAAVVIDINHHSGNSHFYNYLHIFLLNKL